jgi:serine/threonine protein kinase
MHPLADTGRVIAGRYRLQAPIGRGAMGVVWRARDQLLDRDVAVKEVKIAETLTDVERAHAYQRTLREAKTAARLNHPAVVTVYDVAEDEGRPWIVMQLVHAQSLDQVLASSGPLSPRRAAEMGRQLLSALSVAHAAGVMHRDVKPSNVLLGNDDRAVLTDFGIATFQDDPKLTQTGMVMGSPGFTAPERIRGEDASPASDLWSLGATLFAAVEGHGPFEQRGGAITTMSAIINEDAPEAPTAGALGPVIAALLRREPSDRPDAARAARMITDVLPMLAERSGGGGYEPTALSASAQPKSSRPGSVRPGSAENSPDLSAEKTISRKPVGQAPATTGPAGGQPTPAQTAPTSPQSPQGDQQRYGQSPGSAGPGGSSSSAYARTGYSPSGYSPPGYSPPGYSPPGQSPPGQSPPGQSPSGYSPPEYESAARPEGPPPDFSSWYDPSPRSGAAPQSDAGSESWSGSAHQSPSGYAPPSGYGPGPAPGSASQPGPGSAPWSGTRPGHPPVQRQRSGVWWKIAIVVLVLIGAGAGAAAVVLLHQNHSGTAQGKTSPSASTGTTPTPAASPPQIVDAINEQSTGPLPAGFTTYSQPAAANEAAGFSLAAPTTWKASTSNYQTYLRDPSAANVNLLVDLTRHTYMNDMLREAQYIEAQSRPRFPGYKRISLARLTIRGQPGAYWKFTWDDNGVQQEAIDLLYVAQTSSGPQSYALYMTAPASIWNQPQLKSVFDEEARTFSPMT